MDDEHLIERYLCELASELRLPARTRRRILAEVREHLYESVSMTTAPDGPAQRQAIEQFGTPATVAAGFARELAVGSTRRAARRAGLLFVLSLVLWELCTSSFIHLAPGWINDGPGTALLWIVGQVGLIAGTVSLARARVARRMSAFDSVRLRYVVRGVLVLTECTAITVLMVGTSVATSLLGHATQQRPFLLGALTLACAAVTTLSTATVWHARRRLGALDHPPLTATGREALSDVISTLSDGLIWVGHRVPMFVPVVPGSSSTWRRRAERILSPVDPYEHPWRFASAVGLLAGTAVPLLDAVVLAIKGELAGPHLRDLAVTAPALVGVEAGLVIGGYAVLGGYLGLRPVQTTGSG